MPVPFDELSEPPHENAASAAAAIMGAASQKVRRWAMFGSPE
jgi:hypothetical protein